MPSVRKTLIPARGRKPGQGPTVTRIDGPCPKDPNPRQGTETQNRKPATVGVAIVRKTLIPARGRKLIFGVGHTEASNPVRKTLIPARGVESIKFVPPIVQS